MTSTKESEIEKAGAQAISEQEKELAHVAILEFEKSNWASCLQPLAKLETLRPHDIKVLQNRAVVELYRSEQKGVDRFTNDLKLIGVQARIKLDNVDSLEEVDHCILYYNQAVLLYHKRQYWASLKILNKLLNFLEPMEETLARQVCLLLIELHLVTHQPEKALNLIEYVETQMLTCGATLKIGGQDKENKITEKEGKEIKQIMEPKADAFKLKLQQYKIVGYLMTHSLKACKRELKSVMAAGGVSISFVYLKAHLEYLKGNLKKAVKVLNSAPNTSIDFRETGQNIPLLYYNNMGCIHHYMGKPNLACFYLQKALHENENILKTTKQDQLPGEAGMRPLFTLGVNRHYEILYNLGVTLLHVGKPVEAFECLMEAVQVFHTNPRLWLRLAECCIQAHRHDNEKDFKLQERKKDMVQGMLGAGSHRKIIFAPSLSDQNKYSSEGQSYAIPLVTLEFAVLCLKNALFLLPPEDGPSPSVPPPSSFPTTTTIGTPVSATSMSVGSAEESPPPLPPPLPSIPSGMEMHSSGPANPFRPGQLAAMRRSVLAHSAYVALCVGNYVMALNYAQALLREEKLAGVHRLLGHLYAAEALILMDRLSEAIEHLNPEEIEDVSLCIPPAVEKDSEKEKEKGEWSSCHLKGWYPNNVLAAKAVVQYNLTVAYVLRGEVDKAGELLRQIWVTKAPGTDIPVHVIMLALYIQLQLGHADITKSIIKRHCPQYR